MIKVEITGSQHRKTLIGSSTMLEKYRSLFLFFLSLQFLSSLSIISLYFSLFSHSFLTLTLTLSIQISYRIKTISSHSDYPQTESSVFREYKHFKQLSNALIASYPGIVVPYLPEQSSLDIHTKLQPFLDDIISHPILLLSNCVISFLQGSIEKFIIECKQCLNEESRRRSSSYTPSLRQRVENKVNNFFNGDEVRFTFIFLNWKYSFFFVG